ncbi:MAG TPA: hypothetical protein VKV15_17120, partial [Bryobacteraceae bacterium]|nr:hypothetical protein [Bryobacteraceae bacterium]
GWKPGSCYRCRPEILCDQRRQASLAVPEESYRRELGRVLAQDKQALLFAQVIASAVALSSNRRPGSQLCHEKYIPATLAFGSSVGGAPYDK